MARPSLTKTILHATYTDGKTVHRWIVGVFPDRASAGMFAAILKSSHVAGDAKRIAELDPNHAKSAEGKPFTPIKLSAQDVQYSPHTNVAGGLDDEPEKPQS